MMARTRGSRGRQAEPDDAPADRLETGGGTGGAQDEELLTVSPFPGDLADELAAAEPGRAGLPGPTLYLGAAVLVVAGFIGGAQAQRLWGAPQDTTAAGRPASGPQSVSRMPPGGGLATGLGTGTGTGSGTGPGLGAGNATTGTVQKVSGKVIYLKTASGRTVKVTTTGSTKVQLSVAGTVGDLKTGVTVVVQGRSGSGGVTATRVSQSDRAGTAPAGQVGASPS